MSQEKAQLIAPLGHFAVPGLNVSGVVTASSFSGDCTGTASSLTQGSNLVVGVMTASSFAGDVFGNAAGLSTTTAGLKLGIVTATSFAGNFTGIGSGLTGTPNIVAGLVTATQFIGNTPGLAGGISAGKNLNAGIITSTSFSGNLTGNAAGLSTTTAHVNLGIVTATSYHGNAAGLSGVSAGPVGQQAVTADGATTTIDLSSGNLIYMTQSADTTVAFANTEGNTDVVYLVRVKDASSTARTLTWPSTVSWPGSTPTLLNLNSTDEGQVFKLTTRDNGATWYGSEVYRNQGGYGLMIAGGNQYGILGQNTSGGTSDNTGRSSPVQVSGESALWAKVFGEKGYALVTALRQDGTLWGWGNSTNTVILNVPSGNNFRSSPVQIPGTDWTAGMVSPYTGIGIKSGDQLWMWGRNYYGQLGQNVSGDGTGSYFSSPVQIPGAWKSDRDTWNMVSETAGAIKTNHELYGWGHNESGNLGQNNTTDYSSPTQIPGSWSRANINYSVSRGIKTDGTAWAWGVNDYGGLGQNNTTKYSSPVQIGSDTNWSRIGGGNNTAFGIKTDGTLWTWGSGPLGQNSTSAISSPAQIPGTTWNFVVAAHDAMIATKTDGTLWVWGGNSKGALGQNNNQSYSSPIQIPGTYSTGIEGIAGGASNFFYLKS